jgi:hypothetical protein
MLKLDQSNLPNLLMLNNLLNNKNLTGNNIAQNLYGAYSSIDPRYTVPQPSSNNSNIFLQQILSNCVKKPNTTASQNMGNGAMGYNPMYDLNALNMADYGNGFGSLFDNRYTNEASDSNPFQNSVNNLFNLLGYKGNMSSMQSPGITINNKMNNITNFNFFNNLFNVNDAGNKPKRSNSK